MTLDELDVLLSDNPTIPGVELVPALCELAEAEARVLAGMPQETAFNLLLEAARTILVTMLEQNPQLCPSTAAMISSAWMLKVRSLSLQVEQTTVRH